MKAVSAPGSAFRSENEWVRPTSAKVFVGMTIFSVRLIIQSEKLSGKEIASALGAKPDVVLEKGEPLSPRSPEPVRKSSRVDFFALSGEGDQDEDRLDEHLDDLVPHLEKLADSEVCADVESSVLIGMRARAMGNVVFFEPSFLAAAARANAALSVDAYPPLSTE